METHRIALLAKKIGRLADPAFFVRLSDRLADEALQQIDNCFRDERDPYGRTWADLKYRTPARGSILQLTGALRQSWGKESVTQDGFVVASSSEYAVHHQYGAPAIGMDARPMVPAASRGLGMFRDAFERVTEEMLAEELER